MAKSRQVATSKVTQTFSKEMKQVVEGMIQKALKPSHKQLSALEQKLKTLKIDQGAPKKARAMKAPAKPKTAIKAKSTKTKTLKVLKVKA